MFPFAPSFEVDKPRAHASNNALQKATITGQSHESFGAINREGDAKGMVVVAAAESYVRVGERWLIRMDRVLYLEDGPVLEIVE